LIDLNGDMASRTASHDNNAPGDGVHLTPTQRKVLDGVHSGRLNKQIAYDLGISPRTIEIYRANLMTKMQAASLSDLVRMALIAGILGPDSEQSKTS